MDACACHDDMSDARERAAAAAETARRAYETYGYDDDERIDDDERPDDGR
jgi:hypothetical protein